MRVALLALIPLLFGGWFRSCVENQPPKAAQSNPGFFSRKTDLIWRRLALRLVDAVQSRRSQLEAELLKDIRQLPQGSVDIPENRDLDMTTSGTYEQLPEVRVDLEVGAIFPAPVGRPQRFSWYQAALRASEALEGLDRFGAGMGRWRKLPQKERVARFGELYGAWDDVDSRAVQLAHQVRYLDTWVPQLSRQWLESRGGVQPVQYQLIAALHKSDPRLLEPLRELLRPSRVLKRPFLPKELGHGKVRLPIATDVTDQRFLAEVDGALATHWNQSSWAREHKATFAIEWSRMPKDEAFARGRISLDEHLAKFPADRAAMTTGGLSTYVRGQALVLGPGKINPRTLAHELGHLMGFADCYLRTLSSQGPAGLLGTAVLEWDNPLYPDDIMCDNTVGAARAEAW